MQTERTWTVRLEAERALSPLVRHLRFQVIEPEGFHWLPGQYVELFDRGEPDVKIPYSLASAPRKDAPGQFELAVRRDGSASLIEGLRVGDAVSAGEPRGSFVRTGEHRHAAVFVGIGTGVAPLRAMIQSALSEPTPVRLLLLFGCRSEEDLLWAEELEALAKGGGLVFIPTLSKPSAGWKGRTGYVHEHLATLGQWLAQAEIFVCGSRAMVEQARRELERLGVLPERLWVEGY